MNDLIWLLPSLMALVLAWALPGDGGRRKR